MWVLVVLHLSFMHGVQSSSFQEFTTQQQCEYVAKVIKDNRIMQVGTTQAFCVKK